MFGRFVEEGRGSRQHPELPWAGGEPEVGLQQPGFLQHSRVHIHTRTHVHVILSGLTFWVVCYVYKSGVAVFHHCNNHHCELKNIQCTESKLCPD